MFETRIDELNEWKLEAEQEDDDIMRDIAMGRLDELEGTIDEMVAFLLEIREEVTKEKNKPTNNDNDYYWGFYTGKKDMIERILNHICPYREKRYD